VKGLPRPYGARNDTRNFMQKFFKWVSAGLYVAGIVLAHLTLTTLVPQPFRSMHVVLAALFGLCILFGSQKALWLSLAFGFCMELFSTAPFGLVLGALYSSVLVVSLLLTRVFTNRSLFIILICGFVGTLWYYFFLTIGLLLESWFKATNFSLSLIFVERAGVSIGITSLLFVFFYVVSLRFIRRLNPQYVSGSLNL
jgi:hypothetical protein